MNNRTKAWMGMAAASVMLSALPAVAADVTSDRLLNSDKTPNDWMSYHGGYKSWHYSALDQINANNVKDLKVVWMHTPGANKRGVQSVPIVVDGILYYTTSGSQIWALEGVKQSSASSGS